MHCVRSWSCWAGWAVLAALLVGCAGLLPEKIGDYEPSEVDGSASVPVRVRSVRVLEALLDEVDGSGDAVPMKPLDLRKLEIGLKIAIQKDLAASGPFRAAKDGEAAYQLDVEISRISQGVEAGTYGVIVLNGVLLYLPALFGTPVGFIGMDGEATFHLFAPDGRTLVHEHAGKVDSSYGAGIYYGHDHTVGEVAGMLVEDLKLSVVEREKPILAQTKVESMHPFLMGARADDLPGEGTGSGRTAPGVRIAPLPGTRAHPNAVALVIGIEKYRDIPPAIGATSDAKTFEAFATTALGIPQRQVHVLLDDRATRSDIDAALASWLPKNASADGEVFVFFAGHGAPDKDGKSYIVPWDVNLKFTSSQAIGTKHLLERLGKLPSRQVFVFFDSCFSGAGGRSYVPDGSRALFVDPPAPPAQKKVIVFSAAGSKEITGTKDGSGLFSHFLFHGLNGKADSNQDGAVTVSELEKYVATKVADEAKRDNRDQQPHTQGAKAAAKTVLVAR